MQKTSHGYSVSLLLGAVLTGNQRTGSLDLELFTPRNKKKKEKKEYSQSTPSLPSTSSTTTSTSTVVPTAAKDSIRTWRTGAVSPDRRGLSARTKHRLPSRAGVPGQSATRSCRRERSDWRGRRAVAGRLTTLVPHRRIERGFALVVVIVTIDAG